MRTKIWAAVWSSLFLVPGAFAQESGGGDEQQGGETEGKEAAPSPEKPQKEGEGKETAPGEVHTVVKGDTLWDLSQHYLGSPWYWPKVWSYNPEIANPHWIYPGNQVRFCPSGEEVPSRVEVGNAPNEAPAEGEEGVTPSEMVGEDEESKVEQVGKIGFTPKKGVRMVHQGFVTQKEVDEAGFIAGSFSEAMMLSFPDIAYVQIKNKGNVKVGDKLVIFRTEQAIEHPVTGNRVGFLTYLIGTMKVTKISEKYVSGQIQADCWDEVRRGDYVGPFSDRLAEVVSERPNDRELKGYIVSSQVPYLALLGERQVVVVDRGSADGVQPGNTFVVVRRQDPTVNVETFLHPSQTLDPSIPEEDIGLCMAVDVKDRASMCLLLRSMRDIEAGDQVRMRSSSAPASAASR
jgi:hypothetical protein